MAKNDTSTGYNFAEVHVFVGIKSVRAFNILTKYEPMVTEEVDLGPKFHRKGIKLGYFNENESQIDIWIAARRLDDQLEFRRQLPNKRINRDQLKEANILYPFQLFDGGIPTDRSWQAPSLSIAAYALLAAGVTRKFVTTSRLNLDTLTGAYCTMLRLDWIRDIRIRNEAGTEIEFVRDSDLDHSSEEEDDNLQRDGEEEHQE